MGLAMNSFSTYLVLNILGFILIGLSSHPILWVFIIKYILFSAFRQRKFMAANREIVRLHHIAQSPVVQIYQESLLGSLNIRAFGKEREMKNAHFHALDELYKNQHMLLSLRSWYRLRIEFQSLGVVLPG